MKLGTKSVLFGAHNLLLHPVMLAIAWVRLYGFQTLNLKVVVAFLVHDWGYFGKDEIDGPSGDRHPELGAKIMGFLFGSEWADFTLFHSRAYAQKAGKPVSRLCYADKLATALTPAWLYVPMVCLTGEIAEYMTRTSVKSADTFYSAIGSKTGDVGVWFSELRAFNLNWVWANAK
jgi:hypothetical protein